jgi:hypothetical protein
MRRLLTILVALAGTLIVAAPASADCGARIIDDYFADGSVDGHYSQACYQQAIAEFPQDAQGYSNGLAAIQAAQARDKLSGGGGSGGSGSSGNSNPPRTTADGGTQTAKPPKKPVRKKKPPKKKPTSTAQVAAATAPPDSTDGGNGPVGQAISSIGPKHADEVPLPVILLGAFAVLLIAAGAGGLIMQRRHRAASERQ